MSGSQPSTSESSKKSAFKKSLNPGGSLIIDFMNLGYVTKNLIKKAFLEINGLEPIDVFKSNSIIHPLKKPQNA